MQQVPDELTALLNRVSAGDDTAMERIMPLVYDALHELASDYLRAERPDHTLQATALINEAYLRLIDQTRVDWRSRGHFLAVAATMMRRILVDHARGKSRKKRAAAGDRIALTEGVAMHDEPALDVVALDESLGRLHAVDPRKVQVIEMRFFAGFGVEETAEALGVSPATVKRDWDFARLWLMRDMRAEDRADSARSP